MEGTLRRMKIGVLEYITIETETDRQVFSGLDGRADMEDVHVEIQENDEQTDIFVTADKSLVKFIKLRWNRKAPKGARVLADAWERGYGDMEWRGICGGRALPWYFLVAADETQWGCGVKVRPSAMCFWQMDQQGITLTLDVRCGGTGVWLDGRTLLAAQVVFAKMTGMDSFRAAVEFCKVMCPDPIFPDRPVYGSNNWYYAYGESSQEEILSDTDYVAKLTKGLENPPFMVIDDSWQELRKPEYIGGPWKKGNEKFPDMSALAARMKEKGVRPGIWVRFLLNVDNVIPDEWRMGKNGCLDPSHPEVLKYIQEDVRRIGAWGYELIKHDFSTFDLFGKWGIEMNPLVTNDGWHFYDTKKTSAEVVKMFYEAVYQASREHDTLILGCNSIGHLGAGLMHINRTGDDTSGLNWERTRRMGINTLAFRLPQHRTFYDVDADCVGIAGNIPWELNRQWADVLAQSGSPLFFSAKPGLLSKEENEQLHQILAVASEQRQHKVPVDWMETDCPEIWAENGEIREYQWYEKDGGNLVSREGKYEIMLPLA